MNTSNQKKESLAAIIANQGVRLILILCSITVVFPLLWNLTTSLKTNEEILASPWTLPANLEFGNYARAFLTARMGDYFLNSVFVVCVSMALLLVLIIPAAYSLTRLNLKRVSKLVSNIYIACLFLQINVLLVPIFVLMNNMNMLDNRFWLCVVMVATALPFPTYMLMAFMKTISKEYEYAAMIDGCSYMQVLTKVIIPLSKPSIITVSILAFFQFFNEYILTFVVITSDEKMTLPVGLANLYEVQRYATDWGALFAALIIMMVPIILVYSIGQKSLTQGMSVGGLKG
jgi:N-acetylglucosamine transport system permease protein